MNLCTSCHLDFGSVSAFDAHRVGVHEYTFAEGARMEPPRWDGRRCLAESELAEAVDRRGRPRFTKNARGKWSVARDVEAIRGAYTKSTEGV